MKYVVSGKLRLLIFDIENKPGTYGPGDYTHAKVTAIGAQFLDDSRTRAWCLNRKNRGQMRRDACEFRDVWEQADVVVGHNIRRHDIGILAGLYTGLGLPILSRKATIDTYLDLPKMRGLSRSLENLCDRWGCPQPKLHLSEYDWERAYDGVPAAVAKMRRRATTDVQINIWLYRELIRRGLL